MNATEKEIEELKEELQNYEDIDPAFMNEELKELRHKVMHVHLRVEVSLAILYGRHLLNGRVLEGDEKVKFWEGINVLFNNMDFFVKIKSLRALGIIDGEMGKLQKLNDLRVWFSHPASNMDKIREFEDRNKYAEALRQVKSAYDAVNAIFAKDKIKTLTPSPSPSASYAVDEDPSTVQYFTKNSVGTASSADMLELVGQMRKLPPDPHFPENEVYVIQPNNFGKANYEDKK